MERCARCGLVSPPGSMRCDCGYDFAIGGVQALPENQGLPLASLGDRLAARFIDGILGYGGLFFSAFFCRSVGFAASPVVWVPFILYMLLADGMGSGQSLGKKWMKLAVVDQRTGAPCSYGRSFLRNIVRLLGLLDSLFIFGAKRQRLGDQVAGTIVIRRHPC
jgi:uncharacterized RDD family membrane protein YckC